MDRNSIIAFVLCGILFLLWNQLYLAPEQERLRAEMAARDAEAAKNAPVEAPKLEDLKHLILLAPSTLKARGLTIC